MHFNISTKAKRHMLAAVSAMTIAGAAAATGSATGGADFNDVTTRLEAWLEGSLGTTFALGSLAVGLAIGVVKQSVMSVVTGVAVALSAAIGPDVLTNIFGAAL